MQEGITFADVQTANDVYHLLPGLSERVTLRWVLPDITMCVPPAMTQTGKELNDGKQVVDYTRPDGRHSPAALLAQAFEFVERRVHGCGTPR
jgi:hypothetical protein